MFRLSFFASKRIVIYFHLFYLCKIRFSSVAFISAARYFVACSFFRAASEVKLWIMSMGSFATKLSFTCDRTGRVSLESMGSFKVI